jgi:hypothetical protein
VAETFLLPRLIIRLLQLHSLISPSMGSRITGMVEDTRGMGLADKDKDKEGWDQPQVKEEEGMEESHLPLLLGIEMATDSRMAIIAEDIKSIIRMEHTVNTVKDTMDSRAYRVARCRCRAGCWGSIMPMEEISLSTCLNRDTLLSEMGM